MIKLRNALLVMIMAFFCQPLLADHGVTLLLKDSTRIGFTFQEKPTIITNKVLTIRTASREIAYDYSKVNRVLFGEVEASTGINKLQNGGKSAVTFRITDDGITVYGLGKDERVSVYNVSGSLVLTKQATSDLVPIDISLPQGGKSVFIVRTSNGVTFKFVTK